MARVVRNPKAIEPRRGTIYPKPYDAGFERRLKRALTDHLGLTQFGINLTTLEPGGMSALRHWHEQEDEAVYVLEGEVTLVSEEGEQVLGPGMAAGYPAGEANGHHLVNRSSAPATFLEIGTRAPRERAHYPDDDLGIEREGKGFLFRHKDGRPYE